MIGPWLGDTLGRYPAAFIVALALFAVPGRLFTMACGLRRETSPLERPALDFVCSLGVITPALCAPLIVGRSIDSFGSFYAMTVALLALAAMRAQAKAAAGDNPVIAAPRGALRELAAARLAGAGERTLAACTALVATLITVGAWQITTTGSIDRWWYLAYVRGYMTAPVLTLAEPFLGTDFVAPRFACHSWLLSLAVWAEHAHVSPIWLYERACPLILAPLAFSAALMFANAIFGRGRTARLTVLASGLLWMGSLLPVVARLPEDKLFAMLILAPVLIAAFLNGTRSEPRRWIFGLGAASLALATSHALVYAFVLVALAPYSLMALIGRRIKVDALAAMALVLALGALYPAYTGFASRAMLQDTGAEMASPGHPVVRVHQSRERLLYLIGGGYVVHPRLIRHPLCILGLLSTLLLFRRPRRERDYLLPATVIPLALAFVPPLPALTGEVILPWMVYRVLWIIPFAALVAVAAEEAYRLLKRSAWLVPLGLIVLTIPAIVDSLETRLDPWRLELALPTAGPVRDAFRAIAELPDPAIVAAAPEISERIPAITGKRVLAATDRTTIVFSASRQRGEARLRTRAAIMNGLWDGSDSALTPTHVLFNPGAAAGRYCGRLLFETRGFELCEFSLSGAEAAPAGEARPGVAQSPAPILDSVANPGPVRLSLYDLIEHVSAEFPVECRPKPSLQPTHLSWPRPGAWSARAPRVLCHVYLGKDEPKTAYIPRTLTITPFLGRAVDEVLLSVQTILNDEVTWTETTTRRALPEQALDFALPARPVDSLVITMATNFLPFIKTRDIEISLERIRQEPSSADD